MTKNYKHDYHGDNICPDCLKELKDGLEDRMFQFMEEVPNLQNGKDRVKPKGIRHGDEMIIYPDGEWYQPRQKRTGDVIGLIRELTGWSFYKSVMWALDFVDTTKPDQTRCA